MLCLPLLTWTVYLGGAEAADGDPRLSKTLNEVAWPWLSARLAHLFEARGDDDTTAGCRARHSASG
jgi:hypothetical protein